MHSFFRTDKNDFNYNKNGLSINPGYWTEKMQSEKQYNQGKEFSENLLMASIREHAKELCEDLGDEWEDLRDCTGEAFESHEEFIQAYTDEIDEHFTYKEIDEHRFCEAMDDFRSNISSNLNFEEWYEWAETHEYTFHYIWCLYAIAWGIEKFDELS